MPCLHGCAPSDFNFRFQPALALLYVKLAWACLKTEWIEKPRRFPIPIRVHDDTRSTVDDFEAVVDLGSRALAIRSDRDAQCRVCTDERRPNGLPRPDCQRFPISGPPFCDSETSYTNVDTRPRGRGCWKSEASRFRCRPYDTKFALCKWKPIWKRAEAGTPSETIVAPWTPNAEEKPRGNSGPVTPIVGRNSGNSVERGNVREKIRAFLTSARTILAVVRNGIDASVAM